VRARPQRRAETRDGDGPRALAEDEFQEVEGFGGEGHDFARPQELPRVAVDDEVREDVTHRRFQVFFRIS
jgi:hypothetical protein